MHFLARRHRSQTYQRFIERIKRLLGPGLFYTIKNGPRQAFAMMYRRKRQKIRRKATGNADFILVIDQQVPSADRSSGECRMDALLRLLAETGKDVFFLGEDTARKPAEDSLRAAGIHVLHESVKGYLKHAGKLYGTVIFSRAHIAEQYMDAVERYAPQAAIVFDTVDLHHVRMKRAAEVKKSDALLQDARKMEKIELSLAARADCTLVVSEAEKRYLQERLADAHICVLSNISSDPVRPHMAPERRHMLFVGNFYHDPNEDGIRWFVTDVLPLICKQLPDAVLDIVGYGSDVFVKDLAGDGIRVHGHQPFLKPFFESARVSVAPLRYGAGVKGKISMSMSEGVPCVTTSTGAEGMDLKNNETVLIADTPEAFAAAVLRLYSDDTLWIKIATFAQQQGLHLFSKEKARHAVEEMFAMIRS